MFTKFTGQARKVMQLAYWKAQLFQQDHVGTEHIILGLVRENTGPVCRVLQEFHIDRVDFEEQILQSMSRGDEPVESVTLPLTPRARNVLQFALEEAARSGQAVGAEHLLLGVLHDGDNQGAVILAEAGVRVAELRQAIRRLEAAQDRDAMVQSGTGRPDPTAAELERLFQGDGDAARAVNATIQMGRQAPSELPPWPESPTARGPSTLFEWLISGAILLFFLVGFALTILEEFEPFHLLPVFMLLVWIVMLPVHEAGHALMAYCLGWYIAQIVIGFGPVLKTFRVGTARVEVRLWMLQGFVISVPRNLRAPQIKSAPIYLAGPGIEIALLGILVLLLGLDTLTTKSNDYAIIVIQAMAIVILVSSFVNLLPHAVNTGQGMMANDGLGFLQSLVRKRSDYAGMAEWGKEVEQGQ